MCECKSIPRDSPKLGYVTTMITLTMLLQVAALFAS